MTTSVNHHPHMMGDDDGPLASDHYKRAVLRAAPNRFAIEFLPPTKFGGSSHSYGMRVSPITRGDRGSISSSGSNSEYDIWRRWEDCLWFQDGLELEYKRAARQKRQRLQQGKGVKKNGFYLQDQASSWESLPPGPDPKSVAQDIHEYIPKLTKRGTIFRTSLATIEQRNLELQDFVEALFKEDQPTLIKEMRSTRLVTDFFGYWHRDATLEAKKQKSTARATRESLTPSVFSSYFSTSSTPNLQDTMIPKTPKSLASSPVKSPKLGPTSPIKRPFLRGRSSSTSSDRPQSVVSIVSSQLTETPASSITSGRNSSDSFSSVSASSTVTVRRRAFSLTSSSESSSSQEDPLDPIPTPRMPQVVETVPIIFGHNPQQHPHALARPGSLLDALPEEGDDSVIPLTRKDSIRQKSNGLNQRRNRNAQIYVSPPEVSPSSTLENSQSSGGITGLLSTVRDSWATINSTSTYLEGLNITASPSGQRHSMASINTFMTTNSAEAVHPRTILSNVTHTSQDKSARGIIRASVPVSLSDFDMYPEIPEDDDTSSQYDAFPRPASFVPEKSETPLLPPLPLPVKLPKLFLQVPPSPTTSTFSVATSFSTMTATSTSTAATAAASPSEDRDSLSLKVSLNNVIIMLRVSRDIEFKDLRLRIYNKFVGQEGVPLSKDFTVAVVVTRTDSPIAQLAKPKGPRTRSHSVTTPNQTETRVVDSQGDWETVAYSTEGSRLTLRILDTPT